MMLQEYDPIPVPGALLIFQSQERFCIERTESEVPTTDMGL